MGFFASSNINWGWGRSFVGIELEVGLVWRVQDGFTLVWKVKVGLTLMAGVFGVTAGRLSQKGTHGRRVCMWSL